MKSVECVIATCSLGLHVIGKIIYSACSSNQLHKIYTKSEYLETALAKIPIALSFVGIEEWPPLYLTDRFNVSKPFSEDPILKTNKLKLKILDSFS